MTEEFATALAIEIGKHKSGWNADLKQRVADTVACFADNRMLNGEERRILLLTYGEHKSYEEVAKEMHFSVSIIKNKEHAIIKKMAENMPAGAPAPVFKEPESEIKTPVPAEKEKAKPSYEACTSAINNSRYPKNLALAIIKRGNLDGFEINYDNARTKARNFMADKALTDEEKKLLGLRFKGHKSAERIANMLGINVAKAYRIEHHALDSIVHSTRRRKIDKSVAMRAVIEEESRKIEELTRQAAQMAETEKNAVFAEPKLYIIKKEQKGMPVCYEVVSSDEYEAFCRYLNTERCADDREKLAKLHEIFSHRSSEMSKHYSQMDEEQFFNFLDGQPSGRLSYAMTLNI